MYLRLNWGSMRLPLKYFIAFVGLTVFVLVLTLGLARWSFHWGFMEFLNNQERQRLSQLEQTLLNQYVEGQLTWNLVLGQDLYAERQFRRPPPRGAQRRPPPRGGEDQSRRPPIPRKQPPTALFDTQGNWVAGDQGLQQPPYLTFPLTLNGNDSIGELRTAPPPIHSSKSASAFTQQQTISSIVIGVVCLCVAIMIAWLLTRKLIVPIKSAQYGVARLASGHYGEQIQHTHNDELGSLLNDVNLLSTILAENRSAKNRWFANISHELRTPLTVLSGELEAMQAGIRKVSLDAVASLETEVNLLKHLIEDLYQLSTSDAGGLRYEFEEGDLAEPISAVVFAMQTSYSNAAIELSASVDETVKCKFDKARIEQLMFNILGNSLKYTDSPGKTAVTVTETSKYAQIIVEDSAPGCNEQECERMFEALYKADESRVRGHQLSAGLGLAIAKNIVEAHHGHISATPSTLGGIRLTIQLPKVED